MADTQAGDQFRNGVPVAATPGGIQRSNGAWNGHGFGSVVGPNGLAYNTGANGYDEDTSRYQSMGQAAANQDAYQINWQGADQDAKNGRLSRLDQQRAAYLAQQVANGGPSQAQQYGQQQLQSGLQAQQAGAMSMRGGSLAQVAAMHQQQNGAGAYMQSGQQQLDAQHAQEMAGARKQYMDAMNAKRAMDQTNQGVLQQRGDAQAQVQQEQTSLNDETSMGYEKMGSDVQDQQMKAQGAGYALYGQHDAARAAADQQRQDANAKEIAAYGSAGSAGLSQAIRSDERTKQNSYSLSDAAAKREAYLLGRAHQNEQSVTGKSVEFAYGGKPREGEDIIDKDPSKAAPKAREMQTFTREARPAPSALTTRLKRGADALVNYGGAVGPGGSGSTAYDAFQNAQTGVQTAGGQQPVDVHQVVASYDLPNQPGVPTVPPGTARAMLSDERAKNNAHDADGMTAAIANGLAPYSYEYKPEFAGAEGQEPGEKNVGPMAQNMASNPVTGAAVSEGPDGMLRIDMKKATKLSLAAAGHNAQKLREQQAQIDALRKGGR